MSAVPPLATPAALPVATAVALDGQRTAEARAVEAAQQAALATDAPSSFAPGRCSRRCRPPPT